MPVKRDRPCASSPRILTTVKLKSQLGLLITSQKLHMESKIKLPLLSQRRFNGFYRTFTFFRQFHESRMQVNQIHKCIVSNDNSGDEAHAQLTIKACKCYIQAFILKISLPQVFKYLIAYPFYVKLTNNDFHAKQALLFVKTFA